jgi:hypothetical protein
MTVLPITNYTTNSYLKQKPYKRYRVPQRAINLIYLPYNLGACCRVIYNRADGHFAEGKKSAPPSLHRLFQLSYGYRLYLRRYFSPLST